MPRRHRSKGKWGNKPVEQNPWGRDPNSKVVRMSTLDETPTGCVQIKTEVSKDEESDLNERLTLLHHSVFGEKISADKTFQSIGMTNAADLHQTFAAYDTARRNKKRGDAAYHLSRLLGLKKGTSPSLS